MNQLKEQNKSHNEESDVQKKIEKSNKTNELLHFK